MSPRKRPTRPKRQELRAALGVGPGTLWRGGKPPIFTRAQLAEKRRLVRDLEDELGRGDLVVQLARAVHAVALRECRRHERWLRGQFQEPAR